MQDKRLEELTLLLLYLSAWEEQSLGDVSYRRAWKGFLFEVLAALEEQGYIEQSKRAKSVVLTPEGIERARELERKYE